MSKVCMCGSPLCPICKGTPSEGEARNPTKRKFGGRTPNVPRHEPETEGIRTETANVPRNESEPDVKVWEHTTSGKSVALLAGDAHLCPTCYRPYCPECGNPIPVRGDYCKPACRSRAWRKKKAE